MMKDKLYVTHTCQEHRIKQDLWTLFLIESIRLLIHCKISLLFSSIAQQGLNATYISGMKVKVSMESSDLKWYF